jgi:hypothetical protein
MAGGKSDIWERIRALWGDLAQRVLDRYLEEGIEKKGTDLNEECKT